MMSRASNVTRCATFFAYVGGVLVALVNSQAPLYKDPTASVAQRANDLLSRMTLEEKVAQLEQPWESATPTKVFSQYNATGVGALYQSMLSPDNPDSVNPPTKAASAVQVRNQIQRMFVEHTRLGIPVTFITETLHSGGPDATIFPMPCNYAASWNETAVEEAAKIIARDARSVGTDRGFSPVVNLFPDARYGRVQEGYSEDPTLTKVLGAAHLRGLQGGAMGGPETYLSNFSNALIGTVKHYAAYGMSSGGIDGSPADLSEQKLREVYLAPWEYLADGRGLRSVMAAQNMVNGRPMHANKRLLTNILRKEWGVSSALVESDGGDCIGALQYGFHIAETREEVAVMALEAGMDMDLGGSTFPNLVTAVKDNTTTEAQVDRATYNILVSKFASGLFDNPYTDETLVNQLDSESNREMARQHAEEGMVLLINQDVLPLNFEKQKSIALVGPLADSSVNQLGSYFNGGARVVTFKEALENATAEHNISFTYNIGANAEDETDMSAIPAAVAAAKAAEIVIAIVGDTQNTCGEMVDRSSIDLPGSQLTLLESLVGTSTPVVVLLINGRPASFGRGNKVLEKLGALMVGWRPGEEGGPAFVNLISGVTSPSGRLTQNWPRSVGAISGPGAPYLYPYQGNHMGESYSAGDGPSTPLFRFGYGLSYTAFQVSDLVISPTNTTADGTFTLTMKATNTGGVASAVPIQVYFRDPFAMPVRISSIQLVRFTKIFLQAGESKQVAIELAAKDLAYWDDGKNADPDNIGWTVDKGDFELVIGTAGFTDWANPQGLIGKVTVV